MLTTRFGSPAERSIAAKHDLAHDPFDGGSIESRVQRQEPLLSPDVAYSVERVCLLAFFASPIPERRPPLVSRDQQLDAGRS